MYVKTNGGMSGYPSFRGPEVKEFREGGLGRYRGLSGTNPYPRLNPDPPGMKYWADPNTPGVDKALLQQFSRTPVASITDCKNLGANGNPYIRSDGAVVFYRDYQGNKIPYDPTNPDEYVADYYKQVWEANNTGGYQWIPYYLPQYSFPSKLGIANAQGIVQGRMCSGNCCDFTGVYVPPGVDFSSPQWYDSSTDEQKIGDIPIPYIGGDQKLHTNQTAVARSMAQFSIMQNLAAQHPEYPTFLATAQAIMKQPSYDPLAPGAEAWLEDAVFAKLRGTAVPALTPGGSPLTQPGMVYDPVTKAFYTQAQWDVMHGGAAAAPAPTSTLAYYNPGGPSGVMTPVPGVSQSPGQQSTWTSIDPAPVSPNAGKSIAYPPAGGPSGVMTANPNAPGAGTSQYYATGDGSSGSAGSSVTSVLDSSVAWAKANPMYALAIAAGLAFMFMGGGGRR